MAGLVLVRCTRARLGLDLVEVLWSKFLSCSQLRMQPALRTGGWVESLPGWRRRRSERLALRRMTVWWEAFHRMVRCLLRRASAVPRQTLRLWWPWMTISRILCELCCPKGHKGWLE